METAIVYRVNIRNISGVPYLEGQGDLVSRLIMGIIRVTTWVIWVFNLLTMTLQVVPMTAIMLNCTGSSLCASMRKSSSTAAVYSALDPCYAFSIIFLRSVATPPRTSVEP